MGRMADVAEFLTRSGYGSVSPACCPLLCVAFCFVPPLAAAAAAAAAR